MTYVVVVFEDGTLNATVAGPFRSKAKADAVCDHLNRVSEWTSDNADTFTAIAQVVLLEKTQSIADRLIEPTQL